jgi:hypothetical protein
MSETFHRSTVHSSGPPGIDDACLCSYVRHREWCDLYPCDCGLASVEASCGCRSRGKEQTP